MQQIILWQVADHEPKRLEKGRIDLEKHLEDWIERDPSLLQSGLTIVGRQITLEGGTLDLLALDPQGRWIVIEIKRGRVRRETVAQALDYAACVARLGGEELREKVTEYLKGRPASSAADLQERILQGAEETEDREVVMFVVGTGVDSGLERLADYLSDRFNVPINVVSYEVFQLADGQQVLVRELTESEAEPTGRQVTVERICQQADKSGIGVEFRKILEAAKRHGVFPRPFTRSIMYTPPWNHANTLFTVQSSPWAEGLLPLYLETGAFAKFYPVTMREAESLVGAAGWKRMANSHVDDFIAALDQLFELIAQHEAESEE